MPIEQVWGLVTDPPIPLPGDEEFVEGGWLSAELDSAAGSEASRHAVLRRPMRGRPGEASDRLLDAVTAALVAPWV